MHRVEIKREMGEGDIAAVSQLLDVAAAADGHRPLGEHQWLDLVQGGRQGFAGLVAWKPGHGHPVGYAQVSRGSGSWALEFVVDPHHREEEDAPTIARDLLGAALDVVRSEGGGHVHLWVPKPRPVHDEIAASVGLVRGRDLLQLRRPLPVDGEAWELETRPFQPGRDEVRWLEVNNRAFAWHSEQGDWDLDTLRRREREAWFDPRGFLLHERDGRLAGFCWTKVHADHDPPLGEIYVIAVDPDHHKHGLGRFLTVAGLARLRSKGAQRGMLYVESDNAPAIQLYRKLGFVHHHTDTCWRRDNCP